MSALRFLLTLLAAIAAIFALPSLASAQGSPTISPERQILVMVRHPPNHYQPAGA
jgi:hypothetical protein